MSAKKCDLIISDKEGMVKHMQSHKKNEKSKIKYDSCDFESHDGDLLLNHISETHVKFHKCLVCSRTFMSMEDLVAHALKEHAMNNEKHECAVCTDTFSNVEAVIHHILRVHNLVDPAILAATEAGNQLVNVWPVEVTHNFKCYDCGKDVGPSTLKC